MYLPSGIRFKLLLVTSIKYPKTLLYPIFNDLIPVSFLSLCSKFAIHFLPLDLISFNSSISALYPFFIKFPSFKDIGGSSGMAVFIISYISFNSSKFFIHVRKQITFKFRKYRFYIWYLFL
jgi:hypothetical protein